MKVYIMTDMEGCAGIVNHDEWVAADGRFFDDGREILTDEVNAAVEGFFTAGATQVDVLDGHGAGGVHPPLLDSRARFVRCLTGYPWLLDQGYDVMAWVGQHAKAGTKLAHICHTGWFNVIDERINGVSIGEFGAIAVVGAAFGVVPIFGSGDHAFTLEAQALTPGIETVSVKNGLTEDDGLQCDCDAYRNHNLSAVHVHPERAQDLIRTGAERALRRFLENPGSFTIPVIKPPFVLEKDFRADKNKPAYSARILEAECIAKLFNTRVEEKHIIK